MIRSISGAELVGTKYRNPLFSGTIQGIIHADFVNSSSGTGLVHMAPGHGMEDHEVCSKLGIPTFAPVDAHGRFDGSALPDCLSQLSGKSVQSEGVTAVLDRLQYISTIYKSDLLLATHEIRHKYPIDWRTKQPVIVRATEQWFADVDGIKENALRAIDGVEFIPETGRSRLESFTKSRTQWCISRQRSWGVPIPALYRTDTKHHTAIIDPTTVTHIINVVQERGVDAWWTDADDDPAWIPGHLLGTYVRGKDTMDVWFDSGTTWTLLDQRNESEALADVYLEGSDQHRGWFQSSLLTHIAAQQEVVGHTGRSRPNTKAPFKTLITHGFTLDQDGRKMSKSLGNVISPDEIMNGTLLPPVQHKKQKGQKSDNNAKPSYDAMGPDALRLWVAGSDYTHDVAIGKQVLQSVNSTLQKYRITFRWLLGVLADYNHQPLRLRWSKRPFQCTLADEMALYRLEQVCQSVHQAYCNYEFLKGMKALENFVNNDLSAFYFETLKDRIYAGISSDRRAAQMILYEIFDDLLLMLAPVTPLLVEEVWAHTPAQLKSVRDDELLEGRIDKYPLHRRWDPLYTDTFERSEILSRQISEVTPVHAAVKATAEKARRAGKIGSSLECDIDIVLPATHAATRENDSDATSKGSVFSDGYVADLAGIFVVSDVQIHYDGEPDGASELAEGEWSFEVPFTVPTHGSGPLCDGRVIARKARKHKCDRCWRYVAEQEGKLCGRCDTAVKEIKEI